MNNFKKIVSLLSFLILGISFAHTNLFAQSNCKPSSMGPAIDWSPEIKLNWDDFKSENKKVPGFAIAASTCGFGYNGTQSGNNFSVSVYVRFYCRESWHNDKYNLPEVLEHEQLHFDICELYGRKFYKGIVDLRNNDRLSQEKIEDLYYSLTEEYEKTQDAYDEETGHSTNGDKQREWNLAIARALNEFSAYADYKEF